MEPEEMPPSTPPPAETAAYVYVDKAAALLGVKMDARDVPTVVAMFSVLERSAAVLMAYDLPETIEAAPVFRVPAEPDE
jgi:Protein of unknown function (DUF4089)